jgi:thiamine pyrophosphokinase
MSSHHIVREKQEPALLVLGLDNFSDELLGQLLEWSPTVIVTPLIAEKLHAFGIKIDRVITDQSGLQFQSDVKLIPPGGDNETVAGIKYLIAQGYSAVNIITDDPGLDDILFYVDKINIVIYHQNQKIYAISSGFSKWKPAGETIQLVSRPQQLHTAGLKQVNGNRLVTTADGFFSLKFEQPFLFISEEI